MVIISSNNVLAKIVTLTIAVFFANTNTITASNNDDYYGGEAVSLNQLGGFFVDTVDIANDLNSYEKLWIKVTKHSCVWTECSVDDTDDEYQGDNRDGDEQWYQYRTQGFCANAAYSLYGQKKEDNSFFSALSGRCSRRHFINSFFTYGGADNLLSSLGLDPVVYYNNQDGDDDNNDDYDWSSGSTTANAVCVEIEDFVVEAEYEEDEGAEEFDDDADADAEEEDRQRQRHLSSDSQDEDAFGGSLGCGVDGGYVIAAFQSSSCDGNYFAGIVDDFEDYNDQHNGIGCHLLYDDGEELSVNNVYMLLNNSWSCDLRLYPNGCPDPYGILEKYDHALRTVAHGGNAQRAYQNMMLKTPLTILSWCLLALTVCIFVITYLVHNAARAMESKGGNNTMGYLRCLGEDISIAFWCLCAFIAMLWAAFVVWLISKKDQVRDHFFHPDGTWKKKGDNDNDNNNDGGDEEQPYTRSSSYTKGTKTKKKKSRSKSRSTSKSKQAKARKIAKEQDINIKSDSQSTEESEDSSDYVKVADNGEVMTTTTNNNKASSSTTPKKSTAVAASTTTTTKSSKNDAAAATKLMKNRSLPVGTSKDECEMSISDTLSGTWA